ncbi:MAG: class I SAM-dependent methyltransferase [Proteobacteria bacterium]|nr:class I SAM-dependent methyltransferase [Pseudomonadota bacterium]
MNPSTPSRTALATSLMRAVHSRKDPLPLLSDTWGDLLVPESAKAAMLQRVMARMEATKPGLTPGGVQDLDLALRSNPAYGGVILRSRYTEDALQQAIGKGIVQYVIIGAGFDSFLCRRPAWAEGLTIIEVDHPASQRLKRERLAACGVSVPCSVEFVEADLSMEALGSALTRSSFQRDRLTFFSWLGVTTYLTREANLKALRSIATCARAGSEMVFTYLDEAILHSGDEEFLRLKSNVSAAGESFLSGFDPRRISGLLLETGLRLLEDLNGIQAATRYDPASLNAFRTSVAAHMAHVRVVGAGSFA